MLADRWGHRRALITFNLVRSLVMHSSSSFRIGVQSRRNVFVSLLDLFFSPRHLLAHRRPALAANRYSMGIGVQMVIKRVPIMVAPLVGGILIDRFGVIPGVRVR